MAATSARQVIKQENVKSQIAELDRTAPLQEREPVALYGLIATLAALAVVVVAVLVAKDNKSAGLIIGIVGVIAVAIAQIYVIRAKVFKPTTVDAIIKALVPDGVLGQPTPAANHPAQPDKPVPHAG